jgi:enoyl-CoA hydratase
MADDAVRTELRDKVAVIHFDDTTRNAFSPAAIDAIHQGLDRAETEADAVLLVGRDGCFSAGFDLGVMRSGADAMKGLVTAGAHLFVRMFEFEKPVVIGCTGHAIAAGAIALLSADARIAAAGDFKIGLSEVGIGMVLPIFACEFARARISKRHFLRATAQAQLYPPADAVDAGYIDRVVAPDAVFDAALEEARRLGGLPQPAFGATKRRVNADTLTRIRATLEDDMNSLAGGGTPGR